VTTGLTWTRRFPPSDPQAVAVEQVGPTTWAALAEALHRGRVLAVDHAHGILVVRALDGQPPPWLPEAMFFAPEAAEPRLWQPTHQRAVAPARALWHALPPSARTSTATLLWPTEPLRVTPLGPPWAVNLADLP